MKKFEKPVIIDTLDVSEGIFAASGNVPGTPPGGHDEPRSGGFSWSCEAWWGNHNSGSHSEMEVRLHNNSGKDGNYVCVKLVYCGKGSFTVCGGPTGGATAGGADSNKKSFTIIRSGHFNPGENFSFGLTDVRFSETGEKSLYPTNTNCHCVCSPKDFYVEIVDIH